MNARALFIKMDQANSFKRMIGEQTMRMTIIANDETIATVSSYSQFIKVLMEHFHEEAVISILENDVVKCVCDRMFKIVYLFDNEKRKIELLVE